MSENEVDNTINPIQNYLDELRKHEAEREPFRIYFENLIKDFYILLIKYYDKDAADNYKFIIDQFEYYLRYYSEVTKAEDIRPSVIDPFLEWYNINYARFTINDRKLKRFLRRFFKFLKEKKNITCEEMIEFCKGL